MRSDLKAPELPVVIGEFTGPWGADCQEPAAVAIRKAQAAAAARPEFKNTVTFVETHDYVRAEKESPTGEGYHEFKNGETYFSHQRCIGQRDDESVEEVGNATFRRKGENRNR